MDSITRRNLEAYCGLTKYGAFEVYNFIRDNPLDAYSSEKEIQGAMWEIYYILQEPRNVERDTEYTAVLGLGGDTHGLAEAYFLDRGKAFLNTICYDVIDDKWGIISWGDWERAQKENAEDWY